VFWADYFRLRQHMSKCRLITYCFADICLLFNRGVSTGIVGHRTGNATRLEALPQVAMTMNFWDEIEKRGYVAPVHRKSIVPGRLLWTLLWLFEVDHCFVCPMNSPGITGWKTIKLWHGLKLRYIVLAKWLRKKAWARIWVLLAFVLYV